MTEVSTEQLQEMLAAGWETHSDADKALLQKDAGIPHLPTDLTYEARKAMSGEGPRAYEWSDKKHRLVHDLCRVIEAVNAEILSRRSSHTPGEVVARDAMERLRSYGTRRDDGVLFRFNNGSGFFLSDKDVFTSPQPVADVPDGWRSIETVPKDGTFVLVHQGHALEPSEVVASWDEIWSGEGCWMCCDGNNASLPLRGPEPTHWQPLPLPPGSTPTREQGYDGDIVERVAAAIWYETYGKYRSEPWPNGVRGNSHELFRRYARAAVSALSPSPVGVVADADVASFAETVELIEAGKFYADYDRAAAALDPLRRILAALSTKQGAETSEPVAWVTADILAAMKRGERVVPGWKYSSDFCIPLFAGSALSQTSGGERS